MHHLKNWIENEADCEELLPICHTTNWKNFEKILEIDTLSIKFSKFPDPNPNNLKTDDMVYLFYGLPFYIYEVGDGEAINSEATEDLPIGLIFKPELSKIAERFYPFDTGALLSNKYKKILDAKDETEYKIYEVLISNGVELQKLVKRYYSINEKYCVGDVRSDIEPSSPKEENLLRLFNYEVKSDIDFRSRAIEIHSLKDISLSDYLQAIVLPMIKSKKYKYLIKEINDKYPEIDIVYYLDLFKFNSESIRAALLQVTADYYNENKCMKFSYNNVG